MEAHASRASPDEDIAVFEQDVTRLFNLRQSAEEKDALQAEGDRDDGLGQVAFVAVLVKAKLCAGLIAIDVQGVGFEFWETAADGAADGKVAEDARHGRPHLFLSVGIVGVPTAAEGSRLAAIGDHHGHGQAGGRDGVMERRSSADLVDGREEFSILRQGEAAHERGSGGDSFVGRFGFELGEEIHGSWL